MKKGYRPKGNKTSENLTPPNVSSCVNKKEEAQKKTIGQTIDELMNNPNFMMTQYAKVLQESKQEAEKITNQNEELKDTILKKNNEILYLKGKIEGMKDILRGLNIVEKIQ